MADPANKPAISWREAAGWWVAAIQWALGVLGAVVMLAGGWLVSRMEATEGTIKNHESRVTILETKRAADDAETAKQEQRWEKRIDAVLDAIKNLDSKIESSRK